MGTVIGDAPHVTHMIPNLTGDFYHSSWESPEAFIRHIKNIDRSTCWNDSAWEKGKDFSGTKNMDEAIEMAEKGWEEGIEKIQKIQSTILALNPVLPKAIRYDIAGSIANIPRAISGNPLNMRAMDLSKSRRRPVITLVSNMCDAGYISHHMVTNRAAVVCALIDQIENAGYSCEVITGAITKSGSFNAMTSIVVKQAGTALDISRLAFSMGHASFFRRMIFADWQHHPEGRKLGGCMGTIQAIKQAGLNEKGIYVIPAMRDEYRSFNDEESASTKGLTYLTKALEDQRCPPFLKAGVEYTETESDFDEDPDNDF